MKSRPSMLTLALTLVVVCAARLLAQTNKSSALILPPPDWDADKHVLASLVATNKPGDYPLPYAWVGVEKVTARNGWYAREHAMPAPRLTDEDEQDEVLEFDTFTVTDGPVLPVMREDRYISKGQRRPGPVYRHSFPSDAQLLEMRDLSSVTNFLGWKPFRSKSTRELGIRFFTLRPYNSLEILHVTFLKRASESTTIDGILVKRARLHPRAKSQ